MKKIIVNLYFYKKIIKYNVMAYKQDKYVEFYITK